MKPIKVTNVTIEIPVTKNYLKSRGLSKKDYSALIEDILDRYANDQYFDFELVKVWK